MDKKNSNGRGTGSTGPIRQTLRQAIVLIASLALVLAPAAWAADNRTVLKPGWNMFSAQQDVEVGQQVSQDAERQLPMLNNSRVDNYLNNLGRRLSAKAPGEKYPYQFKVVNDRTINAFALPGGPVYINRGVIEAADTESQLAGVIAHEISHVALRHGTNQASKAYVAQVPLAVLGGMLGNNSMKAVLLQLGAGFAVNSLLLKYSRTAETQADMMGTQILYDVGHDPRAMVQFFEKIQREQTGRTVEFFSNHPSPDNRIERVNQEVEKLGGPRRDYTADSREFQDIKRYVLSLPAPPARGTQQVWQGDRARTELRIVSASYGANDRFIDVRERMESRVQNNRLDLQVNNTSMGGNPIRQAKTLQLRYQWDNRAYDVTVRENQRLSIPTEQQISDAGGGYGSGSTSELRIVSASYGANDRFIDVRERMRSRVQNNRLDLQVNNTSMGGNPIRQAKTLQLRYQWDNRAYDVTVRENQRLYIPTDQQVRDSGSGQGGTSTEWPSEQMKTFENSIVRIQHPDNWQAFGQGDAVTIAPRGGLVDDGNGNQALAFGVIINIYDPHLDSYGQQLQGPDYNQGSGQASSAHLRLERATDALVQEFQQSNRNMRLVRRHEDIRVNGESACSTYLTNDSPLGGRETNWLVTVLRPEGLVFLVFVAPDRDFQNYDRTFQVMLDSVRFRQ